MAGTVRGEGTYAAGMQNGIASLAVSRSAGSVSIVPCIICGNCDRIRLFCRETDGTKEEARTMRGIPCGWEHI